jgi:hypothetical protein
MKPQQFVKIEDNIIDSVATIYERTEKTLLEDVEKLKDCKPNHIFLKF